MTDLCVGNRVNLLLVELFEDVLGVSVVVGTVGGGGGVLLCGLKKQVADNGELFVAVTGVGGDGGEQGVFVELCGKFFGDFGRL